ncbi:Transcriptional regulatory protein DegU [Andreprevotia sp. IGB-42]|uniref:response regulator transcription factor n=1 Tax=Andreprevotia sp. IGB-42 TaxID=2497473 RepID=UPI0013590766|nr:response regulator transcription factor [Andreprevotia sp. IGB-42]KAF0812507.1 Transcriptional regulatory protein DegU [Andreprevotia sp. IGB-42]
MNHPPLTLITADPVLAEHWRSAAAGFTVQLGRELDEAGPLVLVDLAAPGLPGLADARWHAWTAMRLVIMASSLPSDLENLHALQAGARGYGHAYAPCEFWMQVLDVVAKGGAWIGPLVMQRLIQTLTRNDMHEAHDWQAKVTEREAEVARLVAGGASNKEIARALDITERTVKAHLTVLFSKLHVADRLQLALRVKGMH